MSLLIEARCGYKKGDNALGFHTAVFDRKEHKATVRPFGVVSGGRSIYLDQLPRFVDVLNDIINRVVYKRSSNRGVIDL